MKRKEREALTYEAPLSVGHEVGEVTPGLVLQGQLQLQSQHEARTVRDNHLQSVVRPGAELQVTALVIEWEPGDVDLAS